MILFRGQTRGLLSSNDQLALELQFAADKSFSIDPNNPAGFLINPRVGPPATFSRASGATEINSSGIVTYAQENLTLQSSAFGQLLYWTRVGAATQQTSLTAPTNQQVFILSETILTGQHYIINRGGASVNSTPVQASINYTASVFVKYREGYHEWVQFSLGANGFGSTNFLNFNLITGQFGNSSGIVSTPQATLFSDGWYRVSFTVTALANATASNNITIAFTDNTDTLTRLPSYTASGNGSVYVSSAQFERGDIAREYIDTTTAAKYAPRFDHNPVTLECRGLLIESSRTNLSRYSGALVINTGWASAETTSTTSGTGPDNNTSYLVSETSASNIHTIVNSGGASATPATSVVSGTVYTGSIFLKKVAGSIDWIQITLGSAGFGIAQYANFNISNGTVGNSAGLASGTSPLIEDYGNGWYRCSISAAATTTTTSLNVVVAFINNTNETTRVPSYAGNTSNSVLATMCQFEAGSHASSYIPTTTTTIVRSTDVCNISGASFDSFYNTNEGSFVVDAAALGFSSNNNGIVRVAGVSSIYNRAAQLNRLSLTIGSQTLTVPSNYNTARTYYKSAFSANLSGANFVINGSQIEDSFTGASLTPTSSLLTFNDIPTAICNNWIRSFRYYRRVLPVPKLQSLTTSL